MPNNSCGGLCVHYITATMIIATGCIIILQYVMLYSSMLCERGGGHNEYGVIKYNFQKSLAWMTSVAQAMKISLGYSISHLYHNCYQVANKQTVNKLQLAYCFLGMIMYLSWGSVLLLTPHLNMIIHSLWYTKYE